MAGNIAEVNDQNFAAEVVQSAKPVLVDFWAPWCGPCRQIAPLLEQLAGENGDTVKIVKVNVDDSPKTAGQYNVESIPTLLIFKAGDVVDMAVGLRPKAQLQDMLNRALA